MALSQTLRGRGAFEAVFARGRRTHAVHVRCIFVLKAGDGQCLTVGFAVPKKAGNAVKRNRMKRLMREAYWREERAFADSLRRLHLSATMIFVFKPPQESPVTAIRFADVHRDISRLVGSILASAQTPS
ncbi:MAG TPA: ribonuclease P protein component [Bacteroidota bacterium]|nr:ribonuclease P protein component [Bacteroidota bacterium]